MIRSVLIVDTYYPGFLRTVSREFTSENCSYERRSRAVMSRRFGTSDAYSVNLQRYGWAATEVVPNCFELQSTWARENHVSLWRVLDRVPPSYLSRLPVAGSLWGHLPTLQRILTKQIEKFDPRVVYFQDLNVASDALLKSLRRQGRLVVGQIASPLPPVRRLKMYDLILSSLPNQVAEISGHGVASEFLPIAFDRRVVDEFSATWDRDIPLSFVGGISPHHGTTIPLLRTIAKKCPELEIYGYGAQSLVDDPNLQARHQGECWAIDMYRVLRRSRVTINRHINVAGDYANNMRLFEATGVGSLLITDKKINLGDYFQVGSEVLAYDSAEEAAELARWALDHPEQAEAIAKAGQARTLTEHTYDRCMERLVSILETYQ